MDQYPHWKAGVEHVTLPPGPPDSGGERHPRPTWEFLDRLLEKAAFTPEDILFVVGDVLEKGPRSLDTLRRLMELSRTHTVYTLRGQLRPDLPGLYGQPGLAGGDALACAPMLARAGLCHADRRRGGLPLRGPEDFPALRELIRTRYAGELAFLQATPVVVETPDYIFVHGGIPREDIWRSWTATP